MRISMTFASLAAAVTLFATGCSSEPAMSLDQQQQAWEEDVERKTCESWLLVGEEYFVLQHSLGVLSSGGKAAIAEPRLKLAGCRNSNFGRELHLDLVRKFPDSPKGQAGETTRPAP